MLALSKEPNTVGVSPPHLRPEADPVSETLCSSVFLRIRDCGQVRIPSNSETSHLSVETELVTVSSDLHYYVQKQAQLLSLLSMNSYSFLNKASTVIFLFIFISTTYVIKFSIFLGCNFFCLLGLRFLSLIHIIA
jgi:hypothetical protein